MDAPRPDPLVVRLVLSVVGRLRWAMRPFSVQPGHVLELLRLLGPCLARPRRADPRGSVVADFLAQGRRGSGRLRLPAGPAALELRASRAGWHLAAEPLAPGTPAGRVLTALGRTSLYC